MMISYRVQAPFTFCLSATNLYNSILLYVFKAVEFFLCVGS